MIEESGKIVFGQYDTEFDSREYTQLLPHIEKQFPRPIPEVEYRLTAKQIGEIIRNYCSEFHGTAIPASSVFGNDKSYISRIIKEMEIDEI